LTLKEPVLQPMSTIYYDRFGTIGSTNCTFIIDVSILQQLTDKLRRPPKSNLS